MGQIGNTNVSQTQMLLVDAYLQHNRLDNITMVMSYHPQYLEIFLKTQHFLLKGDGPLPFEYRHYIALMAAARHQCAILINIQKQEFLIQGGDPQWLRGLDYIPQKLRDLYEINKILAHRPWLINSSHIKKLTKAKDSWSLAEIVHAISLLVHFHSLASFVYGCGVNSEIDEENGHTFRNPSLSDSSGSDCDAPGGTSPTIAEMEGCVEALMKRMKSLSEQAPEKTSTEELIKRFEKVESQTIEIGPHTGEDRCLKPKEDVSLFIEDPDFQYQDFAKRGEVSDIPTFRVQDYSWDDHGFSLVNRLYNDVGTLLDEKFKTAYTLTYYTMGSKRDVDTTMFRRAIWNYIHCMFGIRHDDYDYGEVNQLLERDLKSYIKTVCCFPERTTKNSYERVMGDFKHSEKVHVNLMMLEARMQGELLYALRAVMRYMT